ncbi:Csf1p NDAI_0B01980 [Naumovozyma dairenensis CBS 421]|uniref:Protein CSF1 n=1 Tax=Naumovozyma dairenensis (strain ATCC 10597 / BCRC 20456 / CBS 421 / NBRC 0211 / NRRL Y-12639) TaxID=1071378 RepID=G0W622_NAUDC|nr:hypothetical protein NDAI_0B01980 [Naumovozyma dairenensis CBS 421]CCD23233.1 hypothetical protein NDAI_0B01980 [Naumovozyma dairenensis CBS 421]
MDAISQFQRIPLTKQKDFSWVFLVDWILILIVTLFVIFYLSRTLAYGISFILEWFLWKRSNVKINIESIRISPLGGRVFFKNVVIIHQDYTISFLEANVTWRYWLLNVRKSGYDTPELPDKASANSVKLPCRFFLEFEGLEIFVYNRGVAYDNIIGQFSKEERNQFEKFLNEQVFTDSKAEVSNSESNSEEDTFESAGTFKSDSSTTNDRVFQEELSERPQFLDFLPIDFKVSHGSLIIGNKFTPSLMIGSCSSCTGMIDVCQPSEKLDLYKLRFLLDFKTFAIDIKQNIGFNEEFSMKFKIDRNRVSKMWQQFNKVLLTCYSHMKLSHLRSNKVSEEDPFYEKWRGLSLYRGTIFGKSNDDINDIDFDFANHEYAKFSSIVRTPQAIFTFECDIPGIVPHGAHPTLTATDGPDVGNSGAPPEFSLEIQISGGSICFGPWAQRQLNSLIRLLSPIASRNAKPTKRLTPGCTRIYTQFKTTISTTEETTWRIPTRESSKDPEFLQHYRETNEEYRPFGWIDLKFSKDTYICSTVAQCPTKEGFKNTLDIHLGDNEIRSSVNHDILLKCKSFNFVMDIGFPLGWNEEATWTIDLESTQLEAFILREHITLIADTLTDFSSGEPTPYELFRPFVYRINWKINGYSLYLNVNDHNIVNNPLDFNENCYLSFHGDILQIDLVVPKREVSAGFTEVSYTIYTPMFRLVLNTPPWNTLNEFMKNKEVGRSHDFKITGSYLIYSELDIDNVDTIIIECSSQSTVLQCYGFVIRYLTNVKMNYFGDFFHFVTSEEYTGEIRANEVQNQFTDRQLYEDKASLSSYESIETSSVRKEQTGDSKIKRSDLKRATNETDLWFTFTVWEGAILLPETIYNCDPCIGLHFGELLIDFRSCNYYMDLLASMNDISLRRYIGKQQNEIYESVRQDNGCGNKKYGSLSDMVIHAHRMYGLPPLEPTYFCQWDFSLGTLDLNCDISFLEGFITSFNKISFGLVDLENILLYEKEVIDDMTSLTVDVKKISIMIRESEMDTFLLCTAEELYFSNINFENEKYCTRLDLRIPIFNLFMYTMNGAKKEKLFEFETKVNLSNFEKPNDIATHKSKQQEYITLHDAPYHRCAFILPPSLQDSEIYQDLFGSIAPSSSLPPLPIPLLPATIDYIVDDLLGCFPEILESENPFRIPFSPATSPKLGNPFEGSDTESDEELDPLEFKTETSGDSETFASDNFVIDISYCSLSINPRLWSYLDNCREHFCSQDIVQILDDIEIGIVNHLSDLQEGIETARNIKLQILYLDLFWGDRQNAGISLYLDRIDLEMCQKMLEENNETKITEVTFLNKIRSVRATINEASSVGKADERPPALSLVIEGSEIWSCITNAQVNSLNILSADITIDEAQIDWLFQYIDKQLTLSQEIASALQSIQESRSTTRKQLVSKLAVASEYYQISHDPYVITKPAFITRLSRGHVRENRSWKIITRLRHILTYLPIDWLRVIDEMRNQQDSHTLPDPGNAFISVFSNWRNWEFSDIARSYIYRNMFSEGHSKKQENSMENSIKLKLASLFFTVYSTGYEVEHNFILTRTNVVVETLPAISDSSIIQEKIINVTGSLGTIKGKTSHKLINLKKLLPELSMKKNLKPSTPFLRCFKLNMLLLFERSELQFVLGASKVMSRVFGGKLSMLWESPKDLASKAISMTVYAQRSEMWMKHHNIILAESQMREFSIIITAESWSYKPTVLVNLQCTDIHFRAMTATDVLAKSVGEIIENIKELEKLFYSDSDSGIQQISQYPVMEQKINMVLTCYFTNVNLEIMPLSPFSFRHNAKQLDIYFNRLGSNDLVLSVWDTDLFLISHLTKEEYFRFSFGNIQLKGNILENPNYTINIDVSASIVKLTLGDIRRLIPSFLQDEKILIESLEQFSSLKLFQRKKPAPSTEKSGRTVTWSLESNINYFGLLVPISSTYFILELHMLLMSLNKIQGISSKYNGLSGQFSIDNVCFLLKEKSLPADLSKILDFSIKVSTLQKLKVTPRSFQIESPHFRVCLSPGSLAHMLWRGNQALTNIRYYKEHTSVAWEKVINFKNTNNSAEVQADFPSFHVLSYNFCVGWLFSPEFDNEPGLIIGYSRLFSAYEKNFGKLTLIDAYFSVANGKTSDTFFSKGHEKDRYNRSYLPNMQISYWLKNEGLLRDVYLRFHGEALDVNFLASFIDVIESSLESIQKFQELKRDLVGTASNIKEQTQSTTQEPIGDISPFFTGIRSINCQFQYDGGVFKVFSSAEASNHLKPSFEIKSPNVIIDMNYKYNEKKTQTPTWIRTLITINSTHNTLFAKCAPLIAEFSEGIQKMVKRHSSDREPSGTNISKQNIDYKRMLDSFDVAVEVISAKQLLSLCCEPRAKVQADIGFQSFTFTVTTNDYDPEEPLIFALSVEKTEASIKHIFSREASTSFGVDFIDLTVMFTHPNSINILGTGLISDVHVFFNVKQLQNLYLFLDIWKLSNLLNSKPMNEVVKSRTDLKSLSSVQSKDTDSTIPWCFTLIFSNINGDVDLGPTLGVLSLHFKRTWFATDHYKSTRKVLHAYTKGITLTSKGRLSGILELDGASWISEVNWPIYENINDYPLVSISLNIDRVETKVAFDYHMFLVGAINNIDVHIHSEKDINGIKPDLLKVNVICEAIKLCSTALVAANILDIYNTVMRLRQDNKISYIETLKESNTSEPRQALDYKDILRSLNLIQTDVSVDIYTLNIQISPISLFDAEILVVNIENISARSETHAGNKLKTELEMQVYDASVALSTSKEELDEDIIATISVEDYMHYAGRISGGVIIEAPRLLIAMTTYQKEKSDILEYLYTCSFGDKISVRWNLGPVNFIKEMWATHVRAMAVRRSQIDVTFGPVSEEDVGKRIKKEEEFSRFQYVPLEEPRIDMPQIRDLGDATPPLEWFGLNRKRFPAFTHQTAVILVQKLVHTAEKEYGSILGHSQAKNTN